MRYVTATEYGVSTSRQSGVPGVLLNVYRIVATPDRPWKCDIEYAVKDMPFPDTDAADAYCLWHGWIKVYESPEERRERENRHAVHAACQLAGTA